MWKWIKRVAISGLVLFAVLAAVGGLWWHDLDLAGQPRADPASTVASLQFMQAPAPAAAGYWPWSPAPGSWATVAAMPATS